MNPTDAYRKELRKKELKRVRSSFTSAYIFFLLDAGTIPGMWLFDFGWLHGIWADSIHILALFFLKDTWLVLVFSVDQRYHLSKFGN